MATAIQDVIAATKNTTSPLAAASANDIQDRFLTLLVTQLKNQDPLSPMDNAQITTQLSQISTVSGIDKLNATMSSLASALADRAPGGRTRIDPDAGEQARRGRAGAERAGRPGDDQHSGPRG
jgi:hypothetical protein